MAIVLNAVAGATFQEPLTLTNRDGTPMDLTGTSLTWMAKRRIDDDDVAAVLTATSAGGSIVVDAPATLGTIRFAIAAATMAPIAPGAYAWTLQVVSGSTVVRFPDGFQKGPGRLIVTASVIE
jgi:hypothetical protein